MPSADLKVLAQLTCMIEMLTDGVDPALHPLEWEAMTRDVLLLLKDEPPPNNGGAMLEDLRGELGELQAGGLLQ
jgi:hypothetical protein